MGKYVPLLVLIIYVSICAGTLVHHYQHKPIPAPVNLITTFSIDPCQYCFDDGPPLHDEYTQYTLSIMTVNDYIEEEFEDYYACVKEENNYVNQNNLDGTKYIAQCKANLTIDDV